MPLGGNGSPEYRKQSIWRGYETGLYEVILVLNQKMIKNDAFHHQILMRKPVEF